MSQSANQGEATQFQNTVFGEIDVKKEDLVKGIRIINTYESFREERELKYEGKEYNNEEEIVKYTEIKINGEKINFTFRYYFQKEGTYQILFLLKKN